LKLALILIIALLWGWTIAEAKVYIVGTTQSDKLEFRLRGESLKDLKVGVNGTFFCTKRHTLANWVVRDGKTLYPFPWWDSLERGALVIFKDGRVYIGLVRSNGSKVFIGDKEIKESEVRLAIGGCSYFLRKGQLATYKELKKEGFPAGVIESTRFSFIAWDEKRRIIALGVSYGSSLWSVGKYLKKLGYTDAIRLDGGSATGVWRPGGKFPKTTNIAAIKF
jgi:hypothetical protein